MRAGAVVRERVAGGAALVDLLATRGIAGGGCRRRERREREYEEGLLHQATKAPGTGFSSRIVTYIDSDIAEDRIVNTAGTYSATATLGTSGNWGMQMVTFK